MSEIVLVAAQRDPVGEALLRGLETRPTIERCRRTAPGDDLAALAGQNPDAAWIVVPPRDPRQPAAPDAGAVSAILAALAGVRHLVVLSHAAVYPPSHHHPGRVGEDFPPRSAGWRRNAVAERWQALEATAGDAVRGTPTVLTVLRPTTIVVEGSPDFLARLLRRRLGYSLLGFDPTVQLLAASDLVVAVEATVRRAQAGVFHVAPAAPVALRKALKAAGVWRLPMPGFWLRLFHRSDVVDMLRDSFTVSGAKIARELGFEPATSSLQAAAAVRGRPPAGAKVEADEFGMDRAYIERLAKTLLRFLHDVYWRIEWRGLEHLPRQGKVVLVGCHRGHQPWDGVMLLHLIARETGRYVRFLIHPTLVKFPFLAPFMIKLGGLHACQENADWVLDRDEILAIFPEGIRGAFRRYKGVYKLGKFGRDEFVKIALRHQAPMVPCVTVGSAEIFPIFGRIDWPWWKRVSEWPYLPITPTMGLVPLPSKWHTLFLEPVPTDGHPPAAADDPEIVSALSREVRARMQAALDDLVARRRWIFWGSIFDKEKTTWNASTTTS